MDEVGDDPMLRPLDAESMALVVNHFGLILRMSVTRACARV